MNRVAFAVRAFRDPVGLMERVSRGGELVRITGGRRPTFAVTSPALALDILETHADVFLKGAGSKRLARVMGQGLQVSEGKHHHRERALLDPSFDHSHVLRYGDTVARALGRASSRWKDGQAIDPIPAMRAITTEAILRALFSEASDDEVDRLSEAVTDEAGGLWRAMVPGSNGLGRVLPGFRRFRRAREGLDSYIADAVRRRRSGEVSEPDLLSSMLDARVDGAGMSDTDARDEVISLLLAGRGTITAGLAWTWLLLARHPAVEERLHAEVDDVVGDGEPSVDSLERLPFTRAVWDEALRVYPPAWVVRRKAARAQELGGVTIPEGSTLLLNVFGIQRGGPGGTAFEPERWLGGERSAPFTYLPFGAGPRGCIGFHFATMEAVLLLAGIAARRRFEEVGHASDSTFARSITLRPRQPIELKIRAR